MLRSCSATPGHTNNSSACLTPAPRPLRTKSRQDYTVPYLFFSPPNPPSDNHHHHQQQQPPPPPRRHLVTPTHAYEYPNPSRYLLKTEQQQLLLCSSPSKRRQAYVDCGRFRPVEPPPPVCQPPPSYSILNFAAVNERTNSSPDTGLGGDSGQSGSMLVPPATTSIVRSSCHQLINFCENGVAESAGDGQVGPPLIYPNMRRLTVNLNKRIV